MTGTIGFRASLAFPGQFCFIPAISLKKLRFLIAWPCKGCHGDVS